MYTRLMTRDDMSTWLALAHESDDIIRELMPDISVFYKGFDRYMADKIKSNEAFMVVDTTSEKCAGIAAFSRKNNRITFLGVAGEADFPEVGDKLLETALSKLDGRREITVSVIKSDNRLIKRERELYLKHGFVEDKAEIIEAGVPARVMKKPPAKANT
jgi:ribosomal protein S18 acetylase RimI-like enzyme